MLVAALTLAEGLLGPDDIDTVDTTVQLAALLEQLGRKDESAALYRQAFQRSGAAGLTDTQFPSSSDLADLFGRRASG